MEVLSAIVYGIIGAVNGFLLVSFYHLRKKVDYLQEQLNESRD